MSTSPESFLITPELYNLSLRRQPDFFTNTARTSGIQHHEGVSTRAIRAQTGEPHRQFEREYKQNQ